MDHLLTICSVYHSQDSKKLLELNYDFTRALNPDQKFRWVVADSTPPGLVEKIDEKKFFVIEGVERPDYYPSWIRGSFQHTVSLQKILPYIRTPFALFLDIDCYLVRRDWIREVVNHMQEHNLAFFGIPWHPMHYRKYRYFPAHHALFVDMRKIDAKTLDFTPQYHEWSGERAQIFFLPWRIRDGIRKIMGRGRLSIGISRDTGWAIYQRFAHDNSVRFEYAIPVFRAQLSILDRVLPDQLSYIPKRKGSISRSGFREQGFFDAEGIGWEEFLWKGTPFVFHARGSYRAKQNEKDTVAYLKDAYKSFNP